MLRKNRNKWLPKKYKNAKNGVCATILSMQIRTSEIDIHAKIDVQKIDEFYKSRLLSLFSKLRDSSKSMMQ